MSAESAIHSCAKKIWDIIRTSRGTIWYCICTCVWVQIILEEYQILSY